MIGAQFASVLTPLPVLVPMLAAAATLIAGRRPRLQRSIVVLALYLNSEAVYMLYPKPWMIWPILPLILYIIIRVWILAKRKEFNDDPVVFIMTDWRSQIMIAVGALLMLLAGLFSHATPYL